MRRLTLAIALACVLSGAARAGEIHPTGVVAPPTQGTVIGAEETTGTTAPSEMPSTDATAPQQSGTLLTIILTLISIVP